MPFKMQFESLEHTVDYPIAANEDSLLAPDFGKFGRSEQLHFAIHSVYAYRVSLCLSSIPYQISLLLTLYCCCPYIIFGLGRPWQTACSTVSGRCA